MIQRIMDKGFAYASGGSVYFDVPAYQDTKASGHEYGKLVPENVTNPEAQAEGEGRLSERCVPSTRAPPTPCPLAPPLAAQCREG